MFLCNDPRSATAEAQDGFSIMHYDSIIRPSSRIVMQKCMSNTNKNKVALISGGGAGHEPFAAGFVGKGMLTASVAGDLFASPPTKYIEEAINACLTAGYESVLLMVNNYTGDRLTFGLAQRRSPKTTLHIIADDCTTKNLRIGARGLAGNLFHYKISGAMANSGSTIAEIKERLDAIAPRVQTIGVCLRACATPGKVGHILEIEDGYAELGLGVHGEAGVEKIKVSTCDGLVAIMIQKLIDSISYKNVRNDRLCVLINNLGGMSHVEMSLVARGALHYLSDNYSVTPARLYVGTYMTSLDAKGFSISIFAAESDTEIGYLDDETNAPVWQKSAALPPAHLLKPQLVSDEHMSRPSPKMPIVNERIAEIMRRICRRIIRMTDRLNFLDGGGFGDGDTGSTLAQMCNKILSDIEDSKPDPTMATSLEMITDYLYYLSSVSEIEMGGTSGGLYAFGLQAAGDAIKAYVDGENKDQRENLLAQWCDVVDSALWAVQFLGGAQPGDRSLVDPLDAIVNCIDAAKHDHATNVHSVLQDSALAGEQAAEATANMKAQVGRAAAARDVASVGKHPDPGAVALAAIWAELVAIN